VYKVSSVRNALWVVRREYARAVSRALIGALNAVEHDWWISGKVWDLVAAWLNTDPVNIEEFLRLFDLHHAAKRGEPSRAFLNDESQ
jgi:hypothetical protein